MKRAILGLALAAILPVSAQAADDTATSELNYNYIEAGYVNADILDENIDGFRVGGSVGFGGSWYGSANYRQVSKDGVTFDDSNINIGWHHAISDKADFLAEVGYANMGIDIDGFGDANSDGYRAAIGLRGMLAPKFEAQAKASWTKINDFGSDGEFGGEVQATYHFTDTWGLTGSYEHTSIFDEDVNVWSVGVRASF
jgi:hypothetical protein